MLKILQKRDSWRLTIYGWLIVICSLLLLGLLFVRNLHDFLEFQHPVLSDVIVVSGTLPDKALETIVDQISRKPETIVLTVGGPISRGSHLSPYQDYATLAAATLGKISPPGTRIVAIPSSITERDRVYTSAVALRDWLKQHRPDVASVNIYSLGVRSRRTKILFDAALGGQIEVGTIVVDDPSYDASRWWATSQGFRTVTNELIAYVYTKVRCMA